MWPANWRTERVLLLGGTAEARVLTPLLKDKTVMTIVSQAGRTTASEADISGGFGGLTGLRDFMTDHQITTLIDATHPFATTISQTAQQAAATLGLPYIHVNRPAWTPAAKDQWISVPDMDIALYHLTTLQPCPTLVTLGARHVDRFRYLPGPMVFRTVDPLPNSEGVLNVVGKGPFTLKDETTLFDTHNIQCVVCKNSGGTWSAVKLNVARARSLPVIMIERPTAPQTYGTSILLEDLQADLARI